MKQIFFKGDNLNNIPNFTPNKLYEVIGFDPMTGIPEIIADNDEKAFITKPERDWNCAQLDNRYSWQWVEDEDLQDTVDSLVEKEWDKHTIHSLNNMIDGDVLKESIKKKMGIHSALLCKDSGEERFYTFTEVVLMIEDLQKGNEND